MDGSMTVRRFWAPVCLVSLLMLTADRPLAQEQPADEADEPKDVGLVEETGRRLAQLDVTISGPPEAVASLTRQDLELLINSEIVKEFTVDRICRDPQGDATIPEAPPPQSPDAESPVSLTRGRLVELIQTSGCIPVERDALYHTIHVYDDHARCASPVSQ